MGNGFISACVTFALAMAVSFFSLADDIPDGFHKITLPDGSVYEGGFKDGLFDGHGTWARKDGSQYTGEYRNGLEDGKGKYRFSTGEVYEGDYKQGMFNGHGTFTTRRGDRYEGDFRDALFDGTGTWTARDGTTYTGQFRKGNPHGKGKEVFPTGLWYEGTFVDGKRDGAGVLHYATGDCYTGSFKNGQVHGKGTIVYADGRTYEGYFANGSIVGGTPPEPARRAWPALAVLLGISLLCNLVLVMKLRGAKRVTSLDAGTAAPVRDGQMKMIVTNPSVVPCDMLKARLEAEGICCMLKNERGAASAGVGFPVPGAITCAFAWPELWVRDEDAERAKQIMAAMEQPAPGTGKPWTCRHCGETVNGELGVCWKCEKPREE